MTIIAGDMSWPGILAVEGMEYTLSHGITPGVICLRCSPQDILPAMFGDFVFTDGQEEIVVPNCKLDDIKLEEDDRGYYWRVNILDRRWLWGRAGLLFGSYNQLDPHAKLLPWTVQSPTQLAILCLQAMGEANFAVDLPNGLNYPGPFPIGPIVNVTGTNPPVDWNGVQPAHALQQLCDQYCRRIVYRLSSDSILITPVGAGNALPLGGIHRDIPSLKTPATPDALGIYGSPTKFQSRLGLIAVGKDWDESYRPIDLLSYAPIDVKPGVVQQNNVTVKNPSNGVDFKLSLIDGQGEPHTVAFTATTAVVNDVYNGLIAAIQASQDALWLKLQAAIVGANLQISSKNQGDPFTLEASWFLMPEPTPKPEIHNEMVQAAQNAHAQTSWEYSCPPLFPNVRATDRLTKEEARRLAQETVFRVYRTAETDVANPQNPIFIPGYGNLLRRQQIVLTDSQVDQITPDPRDQNITDAFGRPITVDFYSGYSKDRPAAVFGQIFSLFNNGVFFANAGVNTAPGSRVFVPFAVDPVLGQITFSTPVFFYDDGKTQAAELALQTGVFIRDSQTNALVCFQRVRALPDTVQINNIFWEHKPDVQLNVTAAYDLNNNFQNAGILEQDPILRADYYLDAMQIQFMFSGAETIDYNGLVALDPDGAIQQITWTIADDVYTVASRNTEHHVFIPPFPARRRAEFLPPAIQKAAEPQRIDMPLPAVRGQLVNKIG